MADQFKFVQTQSTTLAGAGAVIGDTSVILSSFTQIDGTTTITMTDFGAIGYMTLEPNSGTQEEQISFSGITQNANGTATLTGVKTVLFVAPYTESSGLAKTHAGGTKAIVSNTAGFYNKLTGKTDDETISGIWTFTVPNYPQVDTAATLPTLDAQFATKKYVDGVAIAGSPKATNAVFGITELSVAAVAPTIPIAVGDNDGRVPTQGENDALVGNNTDIVVGSGNKFVTQTGLQHNAEKYVLDTSGSSTAYVGVLSPLATSLTTGMVIYAKIINANTTTTPTFTFTGTATAKTIVKPTGALAVGDIAANQFCAFIYDGTNLVLQSPVGQVIPASYVSAQLSGSSATTQNVDSVQTTNFAPKVITVYYVLNGVTAGSNKFSAGFAVYNSSGTLLLNQSYFIDAAAASGTGAFALGTTTTAPVSGSVSGSYNVVTLSIPSVTATGFTVRAAYNQVGGTLGAVTSLIAVATA